MKYTHRQAIGLELFFSTRSSSFSGMNECTLSDVDRLADDPSVTMRWTVGSDIRRTLRELLCLNDLPAELIPSEVTQLADCSLAECCRGDSLRRFFVWYIELARKNEADRIARISALNTAAARFDTVTASFLRTGLALNNQRVVIIREKDELHITYAERDWGRAGLRFSGCTFTEDFPDCHVPGYAFSSEIEPLGSDQLGFRLLIDTRFSDNDYCERLMQPMGWHELAFTCTSVSAEITACDYAGRLSRMGAPRAELIDRVCSSLCNKHTLLGSGGLSFEEQGLLPLASFIVGCGGLLNAAKDQRWKSEQMILDALDNRYVMNRFSGLLEESKCPELNLRFDRCRTARYDDNDGDAIKYSKQYAGAYELHLADGRGRMLIMELADRLTAMTGTFDGLTCRAKAESDILVRAASAIEPQLSALHFEGEFPHYRRENKRRTEFLSVMTLPVPEVSKRGICSYNITLSAAQVSDAQKENFRAAGLDWSRSNALDCQPEINSVSLYGELAGSDDGCSVRMSSDLFHRSRRARDDSAQLERYIRLADRQFCRGVLPFGYAAQRLLHSSLPSSALGIFISSLPLCAVLSLVVLVGYLISTEPLGLPKLTPFQAFGGAALLCLLATTLLSLLRRLCHAARLWRYR